MLRGCNELDEGEQADLEMGVQPLLDGIGITLSGLQSGDTSIHSCAPAGQFMAVAKHALIYALVMSTLDYFNTLYKRCPLNSVWKLHLVFTDTTDTISKQMTK